MKTVSINPMELDHHKNHNRKPKHQDLSQLRYFSCSHLSFQTDSWAQRTGPYLELQLEDLLLEPMYQNLVNYTSMKFKRGWT